MKAPDFPVLARIVDFDACAGTARLALDQFWAEQETYTAGPDPDSFDLQLVQWGWTALFQEQMKTGTTVFDLDLRNLDPKAIDMTVTGKQGVFSGSLAIRLDHQPK